MAGLGTLLLGFAALAQGAQGQPAVPPGVQWLGGDILRAGYWPGDSLRAREVMEFLRGLPPLAGLPSGLPAGVTVFIAPDEPAFDALIGGTVPEWGAAVAIPSLNRIVIPGRGPRRTRGWTEARVLQHEWAHLGLTQFLPGLRIPRWFDEGYAEWASGGWSPTQGWRLRVAMALGGAPPLDSLTLGWPRDRPSAELAYLLSATAVEYLVSESGERGLRIFLETWREEGSFSGALRQVYGVTPGQFEEDWRKYVRRRYGWLFVLSHSSVFWLTLTLALLVMVRIRRGRDREGMARLRAGEPPDEPAYWDQDEEEPPGEEGPGGKG
ncbi:MAG: peptidase MA family metallohydrolase [Gemmatimonadota bacterium]